MEDGNDRSDSKAGRAIPAKGVDRGEVLRRMEEMRQGDARWEEGRTFSLVYHASEEHTAFLKKAYGLFFAENALSPMAFKSLRRLETEVVAMAADLLHGGESAAGTMTSGGTESILMAVKTYRDRARAGRPEVTAPEMVLPVTVHPAFSKAAHYLDVKPVYVPVGADFRVDVRAVREAVGPSTIFMVGSAPAYPHGVVDPIDELAAIALERGIGMHVDACVGGFMLPFVERLGHPVPAFDFRVPGVTSMSADLHKYGFSAKGASVILYRDRDLRKHQFYVFADWPGGVFGSTTMAGTRPGGAIAAAWAALTAMGQDGYLQMAEGIMKTTQELKEGIGRIRGLRVLGEPAMSVFAFTSDEADVFAVADAMEAKGWYIDRQQSPASIHLMITPAHAGAVGAYLRDLEASVAYVLEHPESAGQGNAAMYGMLAKVPDQRMIKDYILHYMDDLYRI